jgi:hypothetical protein
MVEPQPLAARGNFPSKGVALSDVLPVQLEHIEQDHRHRPTGPVALVEDGLNALVPVSGDGFPVEDGASYGPR